MANGMNDVMEFVAKISVEYADYIKEAADGEQIVQIISRRADGTLKELSLKYFGLDATEPVE